MEAQGTPKWRLPDIGSIARWWRRPAGDLVIADLRDQLQQEACGGLEHTTVSGRLSEQALYTV